MSAKGRFDPEQLLADARGGRREALGKALELNRTNLALWARAQIGLRLQGRVDASDLVQPFPEVARRMGRSAGAVRILWVRAVDQLGRLLQAEALL